MKTFAAIFVALILFCNSSCKKSTNGTGYTPECSGTTPKFSAEVSPLMLSSCGISGCHGTGSHEGPGPLTTYSQIKNAATSVRSSIVDGSMPQNNTLSTAQKNLIVCWIDAGAKND